MAAGRFEGGNGRRGRGAQIAPGLRPVSEADRISIEERLQEFRNGSLQEMTFEAGLSNHDRAIVHHFCKKMGFKSKSYGKGAGRRVTVSKSEKRQTRGPAPATPIYFSNETRQVLVDVFSRFPPTEDEANCGAEEAAVRDSASTRQDQKPQCLYWSAEEIEKEVKLLASRRDSYLKQMEQSRQKLPIAKCRDAVTSTIDQNQVVIIAGETGCGKSTQVPQFLVDHMWAQSKPCRVICTQPRRISATSVADRVANERGESVGETVGYQIRLESKGGPWSSLMFCTNGVLLRQLVMARENGVQATHIIVDEIHERDCNADFLLIILKDLLLVQPDLRVVLMSATLDARLFSAYFNGCPVLQIPGFTHPVTVYYLEDVLTLTKFGKNDKRSSAEASSDALVLSGEDADEMDNALASALAGDFEPLISLLTGNPTPEMFDYQHSRTGMTALMVAASKGRVEDVSLLLTLGASLDLVSRDGKTALRLAESNGEVEAAQVIRDHINQKSQSQLAAKEAELLGKYHQVANQEEVDIPLIERLLVSLCAAPGDGAVLVFLPGWEDITRCRERLMMSFIFSDTTKFQILPIHSMVPMNEQKKVFETPPSGVRKIVLATNIAETAITIDDVVYVIDSGRMKEKSYDPYSNVSTFQTIWISKANARQRQGRAGRCRPGVCYHLFSKVRAASLADFQPPEMQRTPLEEVCLKVKLLQPTGDVREFLSKALDPPLDISIRNAISLLRDIGALTSKEELTQLGSEFGSLSVHPATSKMLLLAILLNCLDPALTIACAAGYRDPFVLPVAPEQKKQAFAARHQLGSSYGGYSDHLAVVAAFEGWKAAKRKGQDGRYCSQYFLSGGVMFMLDGMRRQLLNELVQKGFVDREPLACSLNAQDPGIVRAVLAACMYPSVGKLLPPLGNGQKAVAQIARGEKVRIHQQSSNFRLVINDQPASVYAQHLLVFNEITRGEHQVYIRNSSLIKPHSILFICTELSVAPLELQSESEDEEEDDEMVDPTEKKLQFMEAPDNEIALVVDRWLKYQTTSVEAAQIYCLRERLLAALYFKVKHPKSKLPEMLAASVYALACIMSYEGTLAIEADVSSSRFQGGGSIGKKSYQHETVVQQQQQQQRPAGSNKKTAVRAEDEQQEAFVLRASKKTFVRVEDQQPEKTVLHQGPSGSSSVGKNSYSFVQEQQQQRSSGVSYRNSSANQSLRGSSSSSTSRPQQQQRRYVPKTV